MGLTRDFRKRIQARVDRDPKFRRELLHSGMDCLLTGDVETGKAFLRDYINATVGFPRLAQATRRSPKSLMRMLGPDGNPSARSLFQILAYLQQFEGVRLQVRSVSAGRPPNDAA